MKKFLVILFLLFAVGAYATTMNDYYMAKAKLVAAMDANDVDAARTATFQTAACAQALGRYSWAAWRYNNFAYYLIQKWQTMTDIVEKQGMINAIRPGPRRDVFKKELKAIMSTDIYLLIEAKQYLMVALELEARKVPKSQKSQKRLSIIMDNLKYVEAQIAYVQDPKQL